MSRFPEIKQLPTAKEMAAEMRSSKSAMYGGTEAQAQAAAMRAHESYRLREELRRGAVAVDLQDVEQVMERTEEYLRGCEQAARIPLWGGLVARGLGLSRQYVHRFMEGHKYHETTTYLTRVKEAFGDVLASSALIGATAPVPSIFALKNEAGWSDRYELDETISTTPDDPMDHRSIEDIKKWILDSYGYDSEEDYDAAQAAQEAAEGASGALDDASDD